MLGVESPFTKTSTTLRTVDQLLTRGSPKAVDSRESSLNCQTILVQTPAMSEIFNSDPFVPPALAAPATRTRSAPSHRPVWEQNERRGSLPWLKGCGYALPLCVTWAEVEFFDVPRDQVTRLVIK